MKWTVLSSVPIQTRMTETMIEKRKTRERISAEGRERSSCVFVFQCVPSGEFFNGQRNVWWPRSRECMHHHKDTAPLKMLLLLLMMLMILMMTTLFRSLLCNWAQTPPNLITNMQHYLCSEQVTYRQQRRVQYNRWPWDTVFYFILICI